jgi:hypothetical protein
MYQDFVNDDLEQKRRDQGENLKEQGGQEDFAEEFPVF